MLLIKNEIITIEFDVLGNGIKKIAAFDELHDQINMFVSLVGLVQFADVRMVASLHNVYLVLQHLNFACKKHPTSACHKYHEHDLNHGNSHDFGNSQSILFETKFLIIFLNII